MAVGLVCRGSVVVRWFLLAECCKMVSGAGGGGPGRGGGGVQAPSEILRQSPTSTVLRQPPAVPSRPD